MDLRIRRVSRHTELPSYHSSDAAGMDLSAAIAEPATLAPGETVLIPCGFAVAVPRGFEAQIRPRSGLASRHGITLPNSPGTIDADYRGEVKVPLINLGRETFEVLPGMRIAQMVIAPVARCNIVEVDVLDETLRSSNGFGSTGL